MNAAQKVDVRGVIRAVIAELRADGNTGHVQNLLDADSAVAELIEAAKCGDHVGMPDGPDALYFQPLLAERLLEALANARGTP